MPKLNKAAAYLWAIAAYKKLLEGEEKLALSEGRQAIPAGHHALGNRQMTLTLPAIAAVDRADGTKGGGFDVGEPEKLTLSPHAMLLFLEGGREWRECIQLGARGTKGMLPPAAVKALELLASEAPPVELEPTPTDRRCTGQKEAACTIKLPRVKAGKSPERVH